MILYRLLLPWLPATVRAAYRLHVTGAEHIPRTGGLVLAANHLSALDPLVLGAVVPRPLHFMTKAELWRFKPLGWTIQGFGGFPVARGRGDLDAVLRAVELLEQGEAVAIFPAGYVRRDGPWLRGAAKMAMRAGVPILPVRLFDTDTALAGRRLRFPRLRVRSESRSRWSAPPRRSRRHGI